MTARRFFLSTGVTIITTVLVALLNRPIASVENQITILKYELRGARQADTNIVIVYIDSDAIETLGWPIRRNFYALIVRALTDFGVKAIGIHAYFAHPVPEYPEYDDLLASVVSSAGDVVLPANFGSIARTDTVGEGKSPKVDTQYFLGKELHLPLAKLLMAAAGIGHENFTDENDVPVFIHAAVHIMVCKRHAQRSSRARQIVARTGRIRVELFRRHAELTQDRYLSLIGDPIRSLHARSPHRARRADLDALKPAQCLGRFSIIRYNTKDSPIFVLQQ